MCVHVGNGAGVRGESEGMRERSELLTAGIREKLGGEGVRLC